MTEKTSYEPGTPSWVDLATPDIEAATRFYGELFGWEVPELPTSAEMGGYRRAKKGEDDVAGMMRLMQEGQPSAWTTHVSVDDAEAVARAVEAAGGTVVVPPMDVLSLGKMGVFADPAGAFFGVWQPGTFIGAGRVNEAGSFGWNELDTRDPEGAKAFYGAVFGWVFEDVELDGLGTYTNIRLGDGGAIVGGLLDIRGRAPDEVPPHWLTYLGVEEIAAALETVRGQGGEVVFGPVDIPAGRFAVVKDPWGAVFAVIQGAEEG